MSVSYEVYGDRIEITLNDIVGDELVVHIDVDEAIDLLSQLPEMIEETEGDRLDQLEQRLQDIQEELEQLRNE